MLATDNDGEALAAARALQRALKAEGLDLNDLASLMASQKRPQERRSYVVCPTCEARARRKAETPSGAHLNDLRWLLAADYPHFTPREREFLENLSEWTGELTEKQAAWFQKLLTKVRAWSELEF